MGSIDYERIRQIGTISESSRGWTKQLNLISWNGRSPKFDLRDWAPDNTKMGKGMTLTLDELKALKDLLNQMHELNETV
ncbi:YdbC family protein [Sporolactobacillus inulinus]|jgi:hypothetical protein|uniref:Seryl-tRNA synthetase n=1 Tax=Sporolactobacillus inulinus CASD TaxID=1069536 RepID=A0A0U1QL29_9BACL|nr:YdbC family protein [Sporolactobacillus inulinus]KLI01509.1 seryl-tRNA synthetase [Sporolactobacillus inulinus CASD]GEB78253.1 hypothetical protein SIN01_25980 [Sporolactobacillus inulinus]